MIVLSYEFGVTQIKDDLEQKDLILGPFWSNIHANLQVQVKILKSNVMQRNHCLL